MRLLDDDDDDEKRIFAQRARPSIFLSLSRLQKKKKSQSDDRVLQHILEINKPTHVQVREQKKRDSRTTRREIEKE